MAARKILWVVLYGLTLAVLAALMTWAKHRFLIMEDAGEIYGLIIGITFTCVGVWMGLKLSTPKTIVRTETVVQTETIIKEVPVHVHEKIGSDPVRLAKLKISQRELEVLQYLAQGLSNDEIAGQMFVSQNTVKTHLSNLYFKLDAKRRTQAVERARAWGLI
jgi:DNA-binding CsgD family transcriptional regulator